MPRIRVINPRLGRDREAEAPEGGWLADICDQARLPIPFSCRSASCATCHVRVVQGQECLDPPEADERDLLDFIGASDGSRLACQIRVKPGSGTIRLEPV
jgi:ferredoxin